MVEVLNLRAGRGTALYMKRDCSFIMYNLGEAIAEAELSEGKDPISEDLGALVTLNHQESDRACVGIIHAGK